MIHLNESILSKKTGIYRMEFPRIPDKEAIINWLENNGFTLIMPKLPDTSFWPDKVLKDANRLNEKLYSLGQYDNNSQLSKHITFSDGKHCFKIYTCDTGKDEPESRFQIYDNSQFGPIEKYRTFDEFRDRVKKYLKLS